jgi:hypothetical protein
MSADLTKKQYDKDSVFFKTGPPLQRFFFSITFNESDKVRIIDSPSEQVTEAFKTVVAVRPSRSLTRSARTESYSNRGLGAYRTRNGKRTDVGRSNLEERHSTLRPENKSIRPGCSCAIY